MVNLTGIGAQIGPVVVMVLSLVAVLGVFFFAGIALILTKAYNIKCLILEQTGGGIRAYVKKAKKSMKDKGNSLSLFLSKTKLPLPANNFFFLNSKNSFFLVYYKDKNGNYKPCNLRFEEGTNNPLLQPDDTNQRAWFAQFLMDTHKVYDSESAWAKYGPVLVLGATIGFALIILIVYGKFYFDGIQSSAGAMQGSMDRLADVLSGAVGR